MVAHVFGCGNTALHLAGLFEDRNLFETLVNKGANDQLTNDLGLTPYQLLNESTARLAQIKAQYELKKESTEDEHVVAAVVQEEIVEPEAQVAEVKEVEPASEVNDAPLETQLPEVDHKSFTLDLEEEEAIANQLLQQASVTTTLPVKEEEAGKELALESTTAPEISRTRSLRAIAGIEDLVQPLT
jgi:hypothetical protein